MGRLNPSNSQLKYPWTESQTTLFNNQNLRNYASMPQYYTVCSKNKWVAIGNSTGIFKLHIRYEFKSITLLKKLTAYMIQLFCNELS